MKRLILAVMVSLLSLLPSMSKVVKLVDFGDKWLGKKITFTDDELSTVDSLILRGNIGSYVISVRKLPTFYTKVTDFLYESYYVCNR